MQSLSFSVSTQQMSTELRAQLSQFGLNPQDWHIEALNAELYGAFHREEVDLVLVGQIRVFKGRARWSSLELLEDEISA